MFYCCRGNGGDGRLTEEAEFYQKRLERGMEWTRKIEMEVEGVT